MSLANVQVQQGPRRQAGAQSKGQNPARRCSGNQVEVIPNRLAVQAVLFQKGENACREYALYAAAVEGQDLERGVFRPRQWLPASRQDRVRSAGWLVILGAQSLCTAASGIKKGSPSYCNPLISVLHGGKKGKPLIASRERGSQSHPSGSPTEGV